MADLTHQFEVDGSSAQLTLSGEIDMRVAPQLRAILHEILQKSPDELIVDLADVPFIDSSGIATLVEALRLQMNANRKLRIQNAVEQVFYTFKITQLTQAFGMQDPGESS